MVPNVSVCLKLRRRCREGLDLIRNGRILFLESESSRYVARSEKEVANRHFPGYRVGATRTARDVEKALFVGIGRNIR